MTASFSSDIVQMVLHAGPMVRLVLLVLLFFSITSWAIIFEKYRLFKKARKESNRFINLFWNTRSLSEVFAASRQFHYSPTARIFRVAYAELRKVSKPPSSTSGSHKTQRLTPHQHVVAVDNIKRALRRAANVEMVGLTKALPFLATTGNTTPFIGLFGTVWGIMNSFHGIGLTGSASLAMVAPGISEALIATAAGLAAAIPAVVAYNHFTNNARLMESEMDSFSVDFLNLIERELMARRET